LVAETAKTRGIIQLDPWQRRWFEDPARIVVIKAHRQSGKDFDAAAIAVDDAFRTGGVWSIVSITQRQADETFAKAKKIAEAFKRAAKKRGEITLSERDYVEYDKTIEQEFRCTARTLHLPGGGTVTALPGRDPDTLAGLTCNVILTEFGLFPGGGYAHWRVLFPFITRGFRIIVISTPRGRNTKFFELCEDRETYSVHTQTIEDSVREGFILRDQKGRPCDLAAFKKLYGDEAGWCREYMCEFTGDLEALVRWMSLQEASALAWGSDGANEGAPFRDIRVENGAGWDPTFFDDLTKLDGRLELGWDVARHANLSVLWANHWHPRYAGGRRLVRLAVMRECEFDLQRTIVRTGLDVLPGSVGCGDATGLGMDSNETLQKLYADRWLPVTFTVSTKRELASLLRTSYGDHVQALPPAADPTKYIHTDLYAIQCEGEGKQLNLVETENPLLPESHCDIAYAGALAMKASSLAGVEQKLWVPAHV